MTTASYTPKVGSIPYRVIEFLQLNEGEELTRNDIATKFDVSAVSLDTILGDAMRAGFLNRMRNGGGDTVWRMGQRRLTLTECDSEATTVRAQKAAKPKIDPGAIEVRKGVSLMTPDEALEAAFAKLFATFEVGDSAEYEAGWDVEVRKRARRYARTVGWKFKFSPTTIGKCGMERMA